jgi:hypothetical protein
MVMKKTMQENSFKILYLPIASPEIKNIPIDECGEGLVDLKEAKHERIIPTDNIPEKQQKNRLMLLSAASKSGLVNYGYECMCLNLCFGCEAQAF